MATPIRKAPGWSRENYKIKNVVSARWRPDSKDFRAVLRRQEEVVCAILIRGVRRPQLAARPWHVFELQHVGVYGCWAATARVAREHDIVDHVEVRYLETLDDRRAVM